ncbi:MAG TPA: glycoside hydrolase family 1 protein [Thermoleophilaceae bacterium]|nr:glycoside hydrolase family 1 protein [Thermoleophilaceae bacterium]
MAARLLLGLLLGALALLSVPAGSQARDFPRDFLWGTAISGFQTEAGGKPSNSDRHSDWWVWSHDQANIDAGRQSGDRVERGPGHWREYRTDIALARRGLGANAFRFGIEWSRVFPRSTAGARTPRQLDRLANKAAVRHYAAELRALRRRGLEPLVTLHHFTTPKWLHDPLAARDALAGRGPDDPLPKIEKGGWLNQSTVREFGKYAAWAAWKYGDLVDMWVTLNEPMVVAVSGYVNLPGAIAGWFPPGAYSFTGAVRVVRNFAFANGRAYDAIHRYDRRAKVGPVHNMVAFSPSDPASAGDRRGTEHADYVFNRVFLNAVVKGLDDKDVDGRIEPGERDRGLRGKADFIGLNYYFRGRVTGLPAPASSTVPLFDFLPGTEYRIPQRPSAPPCPTTCTEFGWEIYPRGFRQVLKIAGSYGRPVYVTENGLADSDDDQRRAYLLSHLRQLRAAMQAGEARVKGYLAWSLVDNFEWTSGYYPRFGFYSYDPATLKRRARPSGRTFRRIARTGTLPR